MKKIFIKDDRLREIDADLNNKTVEMLLSGKIKGSYTIKQATKEFETKTYPFYAIYFGWEVTDYEDGWKIDDLDNFEITIKKSGDFYCATCEQFFTENVIASLMVCSETVEGVLIKFTKALREQKKTLCIRGKAIEGKVVEAIYDSKNRKGDK